MSKGNIGNPRSVERSAAAILPTEISVTRPKSLVHDLHVRLDNGRTKTPKLLLVLVVHDFFKLFATDLEILQQR